MKKLGVNIDKGKFCEYIEKHIEWFAVKVDEFLLDIKKEDEPLDYTRANHLLSDIDISGEKITINIQQGDKFIEDANLYVPYLNSLLMKKTKNFFVLNYVDYV